MRRAALIAAAAVMLVAAAPAAAAELRSFELPSRLVDPTAPGGALENGRAAPKVNVLLPDGYRDHPRRRYPVLWLLHGANGGTDTWIPGITELAAGLPAVIVMPDGGKFGMYADWWNGGRRGDPAWATYHLKLLRRTIERRYRDPSRPPLARDRRHLDGWSGRAPLRGHAARLLRVGRRASPPPSPTCSPASRRTA